MTLVTLALAPSLLLSIAVAFLLFRVRSQAHTEAELRATQKRLIDVERVSRLGYSIHDIANDYIYWSDSLYRMRNIPLGTSISVAVASRFLSQEERTKYFAARNQAIADRRRVAIDLGILGDHHQRWENWEIQPEFSGTGALARMVIVVQDITERKEAELALRHSQADLARAQSVANIGSFSRDIATGKVEWSEQFLKVWGIEAWAETPNTFNLMTLVHPADREAFEQGSAEALENRAVPSLDFRITRPDGAERILRREFGVVFDENQTPLRLFGTIQDITRRKELDLELHRGREAMARAERIATLGSFVRDLRSNSTEWSDEMYRILGYDKTVVKPGYQAIVDLVHPDDVERFKNARDSGVEGNAVGRMEFRIIRLDGSECVIERDNEIIFDDAGVPEKIFGFYQDVTERRAAAGRERDLERQLLHSQRLEALGTLAGGIAHDLNNSLTPILALSKLTARGLPPATTEHRNLKIIFTAAEQARDLVKRILTFSRKQISEKRRIILGQVVEDALKLLRVTIPSSIAIDVSISDTPPVEADASQIHQVVVNLVSNAAAAIGTNLGTIKVELGVRADNASPRLDIQLVVTDSGCGMDEATLTRMFEPFFTTKQVGEGTGLGLSIIHGIVSDHGGRIEVSSTPGEGTRFTISIPAASDQEQAEGAVAA